MEPSVVVAIVLVIVALLAARSWATQRAASGDARIGWIIGVPLLLGSLIVAWTGVSVAAFNMPLGLAILAVAAIVVLVLAGAMRTVIQTSIANGQTGELPEPWVDYLIWTVIAAPLVLAALLIVLAIANRLGGQ